MPPPHLPVLHSHSLMLQDLKCILWLPSPTESLLIRPVCVCWGFKEALQLSPATRLAPQYPFPAALIQTRTVGSFPLFQVDLTSSQRPHPIVLPHGPWVQSTRSYARTIPLDTSTPPESVRISDQPLRLSVPRDRRSPPARPFVKQRASDTDHLPRTLPSRMQSPNKVAFIFARNETSPRSSVLLIASRCSFKETALSPGDLLSQDRDLSVLVGSPGERSPPFYHPRLIHDHGKYLSKV